MGEKRTDPDLEALDRWQWDDDPDQLDEFVARVAKKKPSPAIMAGLLRVFERHPDMDGEELKVVVHALEAMPGYEKPLIESMRRAPSCYAARMINRLLNADKKKVGKIDLIEVLRAAHAAADTIEEVRAEIGEFLQHQGVPLPAKASKAKKKQKPSGVTGDDLIALLGKAPGGPEVKAIEARLGEQSRISGRDESGAFLSFKKAVIDFSFPKKGTLTNLFMPADRKLTTSLPLPMGLQQKMPRDEVHALLGKPDREAPIRGTRLLSFPATDYYDRPKFLLCVEYSPDNVLIALQVCARQEGSVAS